MRICDYAERRGISIVPEIDTPGHALSFTRLRPDLIYKGPMNHEKRRSEMLDAANPETISLVGKVFDEYLLKDPKLGRPVFGSKVVHVGAGRVLRQQGGLPPFCGRRAEACPEARLYAPHLGQPEHQARQNPRGEQGRSNELWSTGWMRAWEAVNQGYDVINTNDGALYVVPYANYYRMDRNHKGLYNNWIPNRIGNEKPCFPAIPSSSARLLPSGMMRRTSSTPAMPPMTFGLSKKSISTFLIISFLIKLLDIRKKIVYTFSNKQKKDLNESRNSRFTLWI